MKKVLLVTDVNFWEKCSGNRVRIAHLIKYLAEHVQLTVVNTGPAPQHIEIALSNTYKAEFFVLEKTKYLNSNGYGHKLKALIRGKQFDTVIIEYIHSSYFLPFLDDNTQIILDTHDIISERTEEFKKFNHQGALYEIPADQEAEIFKLYDYVMALCEPDHKKIKTIVGAEKSLLCPHAFTPCKHIIRNEVKTIAFVASSYLPNKDAISFFIENCWPQITARYPVQLNIYGTVGQELAFPFHKSISLKGFVANPEDIYRDTDIIINPVRFGAGLKIKNIEALANSIPLVTTTHGARGLEAAKNKAFLVADEPRDIIKSISNLIDSCKLRVELHEQAYSFIKDNFSPDKCFTPLLNVIN